jgi:hypothetical protein
VKKFLSVILILLLGIQAFYSLSIYSVFLANRDYVAKVLCINRDRPELDCEGSCFLSKQLNEAEEKRQGDTLQGSVEMPVFLVSGFSLPEPESFSTVATKHPLTDAPPYLFVFSSEAFRPPCL